MDGVFTRLIGGIHGLIDQSIYQSVGQSLKHVLREFDNSFLASKRVEPSFVRVGGPCLAF